MNNQDKIKTIKYLKRTKCLSLLYFLFCFISIVLFAIHDYQQVTYNYSNWKLFDVATLSVYLWMVNPMVLVVSVAGLKHYIKERKDLQKRTLIGKKWAAFILWSVASVLAWLVSGVLFVVLTGGV